MLEKKTNFFDLTNGVGKSGVNVIKKASLIRNTDVQVCIFVNIEYEWLKNLEQQSVVTIKTDIIRFV